MKKIGFTKASASGNDFIITESFTVSPKKELVKQMCDRKYGIGADGLLFLKKIDEGIKMRIFNADGSEAQMCGNGARAAALFISKSYPEYAGREISISTMAGIIKARTKGKDVKIKLTDPMDYKEDLPLQINGRRLKVNYINTGVPHSVIFAQGIDEIDIVDIGRLIRYHADFAPEGTNVNFAQVMDNEIIKVRTYERGVEDETLACGTGSAAAAAVFCLKYWQKLCPNTLECRCKINVLTRGGEILKVYFKKLDSRLSDIWLEGRARIVYKGEYYV